ncbi:MAG: hypothetical protein GY950_31470 [bacterium]|nr:hypothetical protein [bacterium]
MARYGNGNGDCQEFLIMIVQVSPSLNIFGPLSYNYNGDPSLLKPGVRVVIPVANRLTTGWVTETHSDYKGRVKDIAAIVRDEYLPDQRFMEFIKAIAGIYFTSVGSLLDSVLPPAKKNIATLYFENITKEGKIEKLNKYSLKEFQHLAEPGVIECFYKSGNRDAGLHEPQPYSDVPAENKFLISYDRVPYYREIIDEQINQNRSVLFTVPDNLTAAYVKEQLGEVDVYNSRLKPKERDALWRAYALEGKTGVLVGGLSAALMPIQNLGVIISERAGSATYRRSYFSKYNIHFLSRLRAEHFNIPLIEGFSGHTVQSFRNRSQVLIEDKREEKVNAEVRMIQGRTKGIPEDFLQLVGDYFSGDKKVLVVLNRKESFNFLFCGKCKKVLHCPTCDGFIDVDADFNIKCLRCGLEKTSYTTCHHCGEPLAVIEDISIASVKKAVKSRVVESGLMTLSSEGLKEDHMYALMRRIEDSRVVISTPVIVNPYFSRLFDAVIYMRPESYFNIQQYDAAEKIFSMAAELRELVKSGGTLDIFSTFHFHYSLKLVNDEEGFFDRELKYREWFLLPPFANLYHIEVKDKDLRKLGKEMRGIYKKHRERLTIKRVYLTGRKAVRGVYKGILEVHTQPGAILESGLLGKRNIFIELVLI